MAVDFAKGEQWWLTDEENEMLEQCNQQYRAVSKIRDKINEYVDVKATPSEKDQLFTATTLLEHMGIKSPTNSECRECGSILREYFGSLAIRAGAKAWRVPVILSRQFDSFEATLEHLDTKDHIPRSLGELEVALKDHKIQFNQIVQAVMLLSGMGHLYAVQEITPQNCKKADSLNLHLMHRARDSKDVIFLASPLTGGGHEVRHFQQLFLLAFKNGKKSVNEWAQFAWTVLSAQNQKMLKAGQVLESEEDNLAELNMLAQVFADKQLPILKALLIA